MKYLGWIESEIVRIFDSHEEASKWVERTRVVHPGMDISYSVSFKDAMEAHK